MDLFSEGCFKMYKIIQIGLKGSQSYRNLVINNFKYSTEIHEFVYHILNNDLVGFPGSSDSKVTAYNVGNLDSIPGSGRSPGEGNGHPLQYSCLENPMDRAAWGATVHGVAKSRTRLSDLSSAQLSRSNDYHTFEVAVQSLSRVQLFAIPWTAALQASLPFTISWSLFKLL